MTGRRARSCSSPPDPDRVALRLAAGQHGVVTRRQLLAAGVAGHAVEHRVKAGRFRPVHRGVYLVGAVEAPRAREMAAVLACGPSAVVSHRSAARLWNMLDAHTRREVVDVIVRKGKRRRSGVRARRSESLDDVEVTALDGIPVTTPARTLYDLAGIIHGRALERAFAEALARRLTDAAEVGRVLDRHPGGRGARLLRAILDRGRPALTRSEAEEQFLGLVRKACLAPPEANVRVVGYEVDFLWRRQRLVVEIDGSAFHSSPAAFERDRRRDAELLAAGLRVVRVTWGQLSGEPEAVVARLAGALAGGAPHPDVELHLPRAARP